MDRCFTFQKQDFGAFFERLRAFGDIQAPVRVSDQSFAFKPVKAVSEIAFEALRTILPPKKFFFAPQETIISYSGDKFEERKPDAPRIVLFGAHPCDLAGLAAMDKIFSFGPGDSHYETRRRNVLIVGLSCMPDKNCFCKSMGTDTVRGGYDLFLTDIDSAYFVQVATPLGQSVLDGAAFLKEVTAEEKHAYQQFWHRRDQAFEKGFDQANLKSTMDLEWHSPVWDQLGERCLSCGNCVAVCPTCYCFDMLDIAHMNGESGERVREWDGCQFVGFAKVAGEYNFRPGPVDRLKFWYRHKLHGFEDAYALPTCVGCGRCTVSCPAGIDDIVDTVLNLQGERVTLNLPHGGQHE